MGASSGSSSQQASEGADKQPPTPTRRPLKRENSQRHMNGPLYRQASSNVVLVRRIKRKGEGPMKQFTRWFVDNQTGLSFNILALLFLTHSFFPKLRGHTTKFFTLSHFNRNTGEYSVGRDDGYFVLFCVILLTGLRASLMEYILAPFAKRKGITKRKEVMRFSEQAWLIIYTSVFESLGIYLYCKSPAYLNMRELWTNWPNREVDGITKAYVLAQLAFWFQMVLVTNIEERRRDHWQMLTHHFVTIALLFSCYRFGHTRVGTLILVLMDNGDLTLGIAKCLKYMGHTTLCDYAFGVFMMAWFVSRHVIFSVVLYSVYVHASEVMPYACFKGTADNLTGPFEHPTDRGVSYLLEPFTDSEGLNCFNDVLKWSFLSTLLFLKLILVVWFSMIVRVAIRVLSGAGADDSRSDDEGEDVDDEDEEEYVYEEAHPVEQEVGVEDLDLKGWEKRSGIKRQASSSGVSLPGHSDRKELLGRIGCEKQVD